ncbi:hypothetical protein DITRI_Ditri07aG0084100 [Diplodiscus trichospermus]
MAQKVVLKILTMTDDKTKQKAMEAAADIYGVDSIAADVKDQKVTVIGQMDAVAVVKMLKKLGKVDIVAVGPAKEEKKEEKKGRQNKKPIISTTSTNHAYFSSSPSIFFF